MAPDRFHALVEFYNRVFTALVSIAIAVAAVGSVLRRPRRRDLILLSGGLVLGLIAQIVLGGLTVKHRLEPGFVMAHFLLSMLLIWDGVVLLERAGDEGAGRRRLSWLGPSWMGVVVAADALLTIVLGTVVTGAGPHSGANAGDGRVARWHLNLHRVAQVHGTSAMIFVGVAVFVWWRLRGSGSSASLVRAQQLLSALGFQVAIGYTQYFLGIPVFLVAFHILGAALVWVAALRLALALPVGTVEGSYELARAG